jgi:hypothetical protein
MPAHESTTRAVTILERGKQPMGEAGVRKSLETVAKMANEGQYDPDVRIWAINAQKEAGLQNDASVSDRADALLRSFRQALLWVDDPPNAEWMQSAASTLKKFRGGDCFPAGTLVLAEGHRLIPIEEVPRGAKIWGLNGWSRVEAVAFKGEMPLDVVHLNNGSDLQLTSEHHVYVLDCPSHPMLSDDAEAQALPADKHWRGTSDKWGCCCRGDRVEKRVRVKELRPGMVLPAPERIPFGTEQMDLDRAWIEGLYVADGWSENYRFAISGKDGHPKEQQKKDVQSACHRLGIQTRWHERYIAINDADWALRMQLMGTKAPEKKLLSINLAEDAAAFTLRGIMADSGKNTSSDQRTFTTTSRDLAVQARVLHRMFGTTCGWRYIEDHGGLGKNPIYRLGTRGKSRTDQREPWNLRIRSIDREVSSAPCWDIQTSDNRVYLPEYDVTVSQCDDLTIAYIACLCALLSTSGFRVAVVGHAYDDRHPDNISHVLPAVWDPRKKAWLYADPSATEAEAPFGKFMIPPTRERVYDAITGELICDAEACLFGSGDMVGKAPGNIAGAAERIILSGFEELRTPARLGALPQGFDDTSIEAWKVFLSDSLTKLDDVMSQAQFAYDSTMSLAAELGMPLPKPTNGELSVKASGWGPQQEDGWKKLNDIGDLARAFLVQAIEGKRPVLLDDVTGNWALKALPGDTARIEESANGLLRIVGVAPSDVSGRVGVGPAVILGAAAAAVAIYGFMYLMVRAAFSYAKEALERVAELLQHRQYIQCAQEQGVEKCEKVNDFVTKNHVKWVDAETRKREGENSDLVSIAVIVTGAALILGGGVVWYKTSQKKRNAE